MTPRQALMLAGWTAADLEAWECCTHGIDYLDIELGQEEGKEAWRETPKVTSLNTAVTIVRQTSITPTP
jgi:hypothetical protein